MRYLDSSLINVDDISILNGICLSNNANHVHVNSIFRIRSELKDSYNEYLLAAKNKDICALVENDFYDSYKKSLKSFYTGENNCVSYIGEYRFQSSIKFCLMCGSLQADTLDHFLAKDNYPEYSFFSKNLIPACACNDRKKTEKSSNLNPHFFKVCNKTLYRVELDILDNQGNFQLTILPKISHYHPDYFVVKNHLDNHIMKYSKMKFYLEHHFSIILKNPKKELVIKQKNLSRDELKSKIIEKVELMKNLSESSNRWDIVLYQGLLRDNVLNYLLLKI